MTFHHVEARTPMDLFKSSSTVVWAFLIVATLVSWAVGTDHGFVESTTAGSIIILVVAFVKIRFVGMHFMELKDAPLVLRVLLQAWCLIVCGLTVAFYLAA